MRLGILTKSIILLFKKRPFMYYPTKKERKKIIAYNVDDTFFKIKNNERMQFAVTEKTTYLDILDKLTLMYKLGYRE